MAFSIFDTSQPSKNKPLNEALGSHRTSKQLSFTETTLKMRALGWVMVVLGVILVGITIWGSIAFHASPMGNEARVISIAVTASLITLTVTSWGIYLVKKDYWNDPLYISEKKVEFTKKLVDKGYRPAIHLRDGWWPEKMREVVITTQEINQMVRDQFASLSFDQFARLYGTSGIVTDEQQFPRFVDFLKTTHLSEFFAKTNVYVDHLMSLFATTYPGHAEKLKALHSPYLEARQKCRNAISRAVRYVPVYVGGKYPNYTVVSVPDEEKRADAERAFSKQKTLINAKWVAYLKEYPLVGGDKEGCLWIEDSSHLAFEIDVQSHL